MASVYMTAVAAIRRAPDRLESIDITSIGCSLSESKHQTKDSPLNTQFPVVRFSSITIEEGKVLVDIEKHELAYRG